MRKWAILVLLILGTAISAVPSFAEKICLGDNFGTIWELNGGKVDKRPYSAHYIVPGTCEGPASATAVTYGTGIGFSMTSLQDTTGACNAVAWFAFMDADFNGSGGWDQLGDGSIDGAVTFTRIDCSAPTKQTAKKDSSPHPMISKKGGSHE